jgi:homocysteine S-methyltransferase
VSRSANNEGKGDQFIITVEVVPPAGPDAEATLDALEGIAGLQFSGFSVATNPVARPRMSALAFSRLIQERTGKPAILHCTTRDHNRLGLQALLWGARGLGIGTVLVATGDYVALGEQSAITTVGDIDVLELVALAREAELCTGVVFDPHPEADGFDVALHRLVQKVAAGAQFAVTQPVYDSDVAIHWASSLRCVSIPILLGILPLRSARHAEFLDRKVAGIAVCEAVHEQLRGAKDPQLAGLDNARTMLRVARSHFSGVCLMPPFGHYEVVDDLLGW